MDSVEVKIYKKNNASFVLFNDLLLVCFDNKSLNRVHISKCLISFFLKFYNLFLVKIIKIKENLIEVLIFFMFIFFVK